MMKLKHKRRWILGLILLIIWLIIAFSCGPAHKLRKAERLMNEAIAMGAKIKADTVFVTKVIPGENTTIEVPIEKWFTKYRDTIVYQDRIKTHFKITSDTVRVSVECPPDTIKVPVTVHKSIICPDCPKDKFWKGVGYGAGGLLILLILYGALRLLKP